MAGYTGPIVAFKLGGKGDMTEANTLWTSKGKQPQRIGAGIIVEDHVYIANADSGTAHCYELKTGKRKWRARLGGGAQGFLVDLGLREIVDLAHAIIERMECRPRGLAFGVVAWATLRMHCRSDIAPNFQVFHLP